MVLTKTIDKQRLLVHLHFKLFFFLKELFLHLKIIHSENIELIHYLRGTNSFPYLIATFMPEGSLFIEIHLSRHMGKPTICLGENKGADQLRSNCEADQRLCFRYTDSTLPLLLKSEISSF